MTTPARADLLALTPDVLAAIANRGLVRRAARELDAGAFPELSVTPDGGVVARFADGAEAVMPPGASLDGGVCGCDAPGVCRHLVGLVLAHQRAAAVARAEAKTSAVGPAEEGPPTVTASEAGVSHVATSDVGASDLAASDASALGTDAPDWSPGDMDDEALGAAVGPRALTAARRIAERGAAVRVHRPTPRQPYPWVELPTCTLRFPVPGQAAHALTDAADALRGEMLALAVWAFRAADATDPRADLVLVSLRAPAAGGGARPAPAVRPSLVAHPSPGASPAPDTSPTPGRPEDRSAGTPRRRPVSPAPLRQVVELADELLREGVAHADAMQTAALRTAGRRLTAASSHWPAAAAVELADQLDAYADRSALHRPETAASLLAELHARHRAAGHPEVLGTGESAETPLRRVRLTALGCRVSGSAERPVTEVYFAHAAAGVVLVLRKDRPVAGRGGGPPAPGSAGPTAPPPTGHTLGAGRLAGTTLSALATGNLVSESARRTPSRRLVLARGRLAATTVSPVGRSWSGLPEPLLVRDVTTLAEAADARPPRLIRARVEAESVRVVEVSEVLKVGYDPAEQVLKATVRDASGHPVLVHAPHNPLCPAALDALASALVEGQVTHLSGAVRHSGGQVLLTPLALLGPGGVLVPDLAPPTVPPPLPLADRTPPDPLSTAVDTALTALADAAHHGLRHLPRSAVDRLREAADRLTRTGLSTSANLLRRLLDTLDHDHASAHAHAHAVDRHHPRHHDRHHDRPHDRPHERHHDRTATAVWTDACIRLHATADLGHHAPRG
ncbi:hypothetical protein [Streptomyces griseiscabiei]|uniref:SWIM-type domain-containing protein n=1 Tax=Streptomyces griseiscabiei TaxID=2993540 RepID=A0ABU4L5J0_9ACTN|nr:hypothetical protein [Streptomyces griseiscabiei]MBZ3902012.1 hypothetical protein [Streptomyces griseiscabiei]MDX2910786.1 hypothetical protein [Streptomyces griseiscabiei]